MGKKKSVNTTEKTKSSGSHHSHSGKRKERGIEPYITVPLVYILISLIFVLPLFVGFVNTSVNAVHKFQNSFSADYCDYYVYSTRFDNKTLDYNKISLCEKVGVLRCSSVGIEQDVYYGINRVSLRNGVALSTESSFDGNPSLSAAGYSKGALKGLNNLEEGDSITFETTDKIYEFTVVSNTVKSAPANENGAGLVISCDNEEKAFSEMGKDNRYVVCELSQVNNRKGE